MKKLIALILTLTVVAATISAKPSKKEVQMKQEQLIDRMEIRELVDRYEDTYEKIDGRWWITQRDQIFVHREQ